MVNNHYSRAFVAPLALPNQGLAAVSSSVCATTLSVPKAASARNTFMLPKMEQTTTTRQGKGEKKKAPLTFSKDIKGNIVWTLRSATKDDVDAIMPLVEHVLPRPLVEAFVKDSPCSTVCETSVKGTKEGEGFNSKIMGVVLTNITTFVQDEGKLSETEKNATPKRHGYLVTVQVDDEFPDPETPQKLLLGSLKKMKDYNVTEVEHVNDNKKRIELLEECHFKPNGKNDLDLPQFICRLSSENPDPKKKMM